MNCFTNDCIKKLLLEDDAPLLLTREYKLERQLHALKALAQRCIALETNASAHFHLPTHALQVEATREELIDEVQDISATFKDVFHDGSMGKDIEDEIPYLRSALALESKGNVAKPLSPEAAKAFFFHHLANVLKILTLAENHTYEKLARERAKLPPQHRFCCRISVLGLVAFAIFTAAFIIYLLFSISDVTKSKINADAPTSASAADAPANSNGSSDAHNMPKAEFSAPIVVVIPQNLEIGGTESKPKNQLATDKEQKKPPSDTSGAGQGNNSTDKHKLPSLTAPALIVVGICALLAIIWAIQSYWRLVIIDERDKRWHPPETDSDWSGPYAFHSLAQSHKEWAQLWFSWCVAIFLSGVTYAIYNSAHGVEDGTKDFSVMLVTMLNNYLHHGLVYALFAFAWYWASKHYRSHWHNYVANAYRHRSLYRFEMLRREIPRRMIGEAESYKEEANKTILELFRLSGILLLIPGESSYLDKPAGEDVSKAILRMEEVANAFGHRAEGSGKH